MRTVRLVLATLTTALAVFAASDAVIAAQSRDKPSTVTFTIEGMT